MQKFLTLGIWLLMPCIVAAKPLPVALELVRIAVDRVGESAGDEVYFSVTEYSNQKRPVEYRIPDFPLHWPSKHLEQVQSVSLWQGKLQEEESIQLVVSLIEHDSPPWFVDDHLGSIKLNLKQESGHLKSQWGIPNFQDQTQVSTSDDLTYAFQGPEGAYAVTFKLTAIPR